MTKRNKPESIIETLKNIQRLIEDPASSAGEKRNGARLLERLMLKYDITETDLIEQEERYFGFSYFNDFELKLIGQIAYAVTNGRVDKYTKSDPETNKISKKKIWIKLMVIEGKEIEILYQFHRQALNESLLTYYEAFIRSNLIYPKNPNLRTNPTKEELIRLMKIANLANHIEPTQIPTNRLMLNGKS